MRLMAIRKGLRRMISKNEFVERIKLLRKAIPSKTGEATYAHFSLHQNILSFQRVNKGTFWKLNVDVLYDIYRAHNFINTTVVKGATGGRVNSPSVAILIAIGCIDRD